MRKIFSILVLTLFLTPFCNGQLLSLSQNFKEDFTIEKYLHDQYVANMLNTLAINAAQNISQTEYSIYYSIDISDSLYFLYCPPIGSVEYSGNNISTYLIPEKVHIRCGSMNVDLPLTASKTCYSFPKPDWLGVAECHFIYSDSDLDTFNEKVNAIRKGTALEIIADSLISIINSYNAFEAYRSADVLMFLTIIDSQIGYLDNSMYSIAVNHEDIDIRSLSEKMRLLKSRRNSVFMTYPISTAASIDLNDILSTNLGIHFCNFYDKWCYMSDASKHLYAGEIAYMSNFNKTQPKIENFISKLSPSSAKIFLNNVYQRLLNGAEKAFKNNSIDIALTLIDNYEYISHIYANSNSAPFYSLKLQCYQAMFTSYEKLADLFDKNNHDAISRSYSDKAADILKQIDILEASPYPPDASTTTIDNSIGILAVDNPKVATSTNSTIVRPAVVTPKPVAVTPKPAVEQKEEKPTKVEPQLEEEPVVVAVVTPTPEAKKPQAAVEEEETSKVVVNKLDDSSANSRCKEYFKKMNILADNISSYSIFTLQNLVNRYNSEYSDCETLSLEDWLTSIGHPEMIPDTDKKKKRR